MVSHVYRKGNMCAYIIANEGMKNIGYIYLSEMSRILSNNFIKNKLRLSNFNFGVSCCRMKNTRMFARSK